MLQDQTKEQQVKDDTTIKLVRTRELRRKNIDAITNRPDPTTFKNLDGSIKKNTSFVKKLKQGITQDQLSSLSKELLSLKLEKYLSEIVSAIAESRIRSSSDLSAAVEICSLLHQRFAAFAPELIPALHKQLGPPPSTHGMTPDQKEKEETARLGKQRSTLRFLTELYIVGIAQDGPKDLLIVDILKDMLLTDKENHVNLPIAVAFVKYYGDQFLGVIVQRNRPRSDSAASVTETRPSEGQEQDSNTRTNAVTPTHSGEELVPNSVQAAVKAVLVEYYRSVERHLLRDHKRIRQVEKNNHEHYIARGEINEDRQDRYEKSLKAYEKLLASAQTLAEALDLELPDLPKDEGMTRLGIGIADSSKEREEKESTSGIWEDEDAKAFYENLIDLKNHVPAIFLGEKKPKTEEPIQDETTGQVRTETAQDLEPVETTEDAVNDDNATQEADAADANDEEEDADGEDDDKTKTLSGTAQAALEAILNRMPNALNRDTIDQIAIEFAYHNSKSARKKLVRTILAVPRQRLDLLPYYGRLIATLNPYMPDVGTAVVEQLEKSFHGHQKRKEQVFIEEKTKNIRFIGELTKFKVTPLHVVFHCIKVLLDDFKHHNVDLLCTLLETCGRFLYKSPETSTRTANYLDILMRKKNVKNVDNRQTLMIENAFYQCNPPDKPAITAKQRPPLELYVRKLIYSDLSKKTVDKILKQLRKLNWEDNTIRRMLTKIFCKIWKVKFSHLHMMAYLACELSRYYPEFGVSIVDNTLEEVRIGLEQNIFKHNQRRVAIMKYLGELYNYRMVDSAVIFTALYHIVNFGHENNLPRYGIGSPLDAQHDFFRVRLCCTLLDTCGQCFDRGASAKRLDEFLAYFQMYIHTKPRAPMDIDFTISETFELLRPNLKLAQDYQEAVIRVNEIAMEQMQAAQNGNGSGGLGGDDSEDDDDDDDEDGGAGPRGQNRGADMDEEDPEGREVLAPEEDDQVDRDDEVVVVHMQHDVDEEADDDFEREFSRMMQESMESRRNDRKSTFDAPVPVRTKTIGGSESQEETAEGQVAFTLLTKKGNKQQAKVMALPADSSFVLSTRSKQEAEQEEKQQLKQLVLNYEEREREAARRAAAIAENAVWNGRGQTVLLSSSGHRGGFYRGNNAGYQSGYRGGRNDNSARGGRGRGYYGHRRGGFEGSSGSRGGYS